MKILLIEDDPKLSAAVRRGLEAEGFTVDVAFDGDDGYWMATEGTYDAIVLDVMLPGRNGFHVCADLREAGNWTPLLMLTAKDGDLDEAEGLPGEDDPWAAELSRRIDVTYSLLRRLCAIPACTAGDMARKVIAFRVVEADSWDDTCDQTVTAEMSLKALLADAERLTGGRAT